MGSVPGPSQWKKEHGSPIAKASDIQDVKRQQQEGESFDDRLAQIDMRQRRIEKLLEQLVKAEGKGHVSLDVFDDT